MILIIIGFIAAAKKFGLYNLIKPDTIRETILSYGFFAPLAFIILYVVATIFFLPGTPLTIAGGLIFGKIFGTLYTVVGATIGATIAFLLARFLGESFVENLLKGKYKKSFSLIFGIYPSGAPHLHRIRF